MSSLRRRVTENRLITVILNVIPAREPAGHGIHSSEMSQFAGRMTDYSDGFGLPEDGIGCHAATEG